MAPTLSISAVTFASGLTFGPKATRGRPFCRLSSELHEGPTFVTCVTFEKQQAAHWVSKPKPAALAISRSRARNVLFSTS